MSWLVCPLITLALAPWCYFVVHRSRSPRTPALVGVVAAASLPFWLPADLPELRAVVAVAAVTLTAKCHELGRRRVHDPRMLESPWWLATWLYLPPDTRRPRSDEDAARTRRGGAIRLLRGLMKLPVLLGLLALATVRPELHDHLLAAMAWVLVMTYLCLSTLSDLASGLVMRTGLDVAEMFDKPPLARSPRDFWGRRWNLFVSRWAFRNVFVPVGGRRHPLLATLAVFAASGLMHEYIVFGALGRPPEHVGWMTAFFILHGLATVLEIVVARRARRRTLLPRPVAIAAHVVWFTATAPLFFAPFDEALRFTRWHLW